MRGPTLFSGYWRAPETNANDFRGGWFHMGDVFVRNADGTLDFVDRVKYLIKSGGENIYPAEIERVLLQDPRVVDAAVVRKPDAKWGEVPVAFVARRDDTADRRGAASRGAARSSPATSSRRRSTSSRRRIPAQRVRQDPAPRARTKTEGKTIMSSEPEAPTTSIASHSAEDVFVRGKSLCKELIGQHSFTEMVCFQILGRVPTPDQTALIDACLVALMEHGLTPSVLAARLTYSSAPEAVQGAVAAGLLGVGSRFVGSMEGCAALLQRIVTAEDGAAEATRIAVEHAPRARRCPASAIRRTSPTIRAPSACSNSPARARWRAGTSRRSKRLSSAIDAVLWQPHHHQRHRRHRGGARRLRRAGRDHPRLRAHRPLRRPGRAPLRGTPEARHARDLGSSGAGGTVEGLKDEGG